MIKKRIYSLVALGGTFDHFHKGHESFIKHSFLLSKKAIIGITTDKMAKERKKFPQAIQPFKKRNKILIDFLKKQKLYEKTEIIILEDIYGITLDPNLPIEALIATEPTYKGARQIVNKRLELGLTKLPIHLCAMIRSKDKRYLSSTRIRQGRISRKGEAYSHLFRKDKDITPRLNKILKSPQGVLIKNNIIQKLKKIISKSGTYKIALVGDFITWFFISNNIPFDYAVIDLKINRKPNDKLADQPIIFSKNNAPGHISYAASTAIYRLIRKHQKGIIKINGEEDLLVFPFVLGLPLNSLVIYGQPNEGCVVVKINEKTKEKFARLLKI